VSLQAELLKNWSELKITIHKIAAEMPADKYGFRPTEAHQTFGERTVHIATVNVALLGSLDGTATPKPTIDPKATTKDAAIKALDDSFDYGVALLKQQTDETLWQPVASPPRFFWGVLTRENHHLLCRPHVGYLRADGRVSAIERSCATGQPENVAMNRRESVKPGGIPKGCRDAGHNSRSLHPKASESTSWSSPLRTCSPGGTKFEDSNGIKTKAGE
jgi:hypothetical protein